MMQKHTKKTTKNWEKQRQRQRRRRRRDPKLISKKFQQWKIPTIFLRSYRLYCLNSIQALYKITHQCVEWTLSIGEWYYYSYTGFLFENYCHFIFKLKKFKKCPVQRVAKMYLMSNGQQSSDSVWLANIIESHPFQ